MFLEALLKSESFIIPPFLPAVNPIPFKHMLLCKLYVSGIVVHPSVSGLYHDSTTTTAAAAFVPSQQTSTSCKLEAAPLWSSQTGAFFQDLSTLFICRRRDDLPCMATTGLDNLFDKSTRRDSRDHRTRIKGTKGEGETHTHSRCSHCAAPRDNVVALPLWSCTP